MVGFVWQDTLLSATGYKAIFIRIFGGLPVSAMAWYLSRNLGARRFISYISAFFWLMYTCLTAALFISYGSGPGGLTSSIGLGSFLIIIFGIFTFSNLRLWASILVGLLTLLIYTVSIAFWTKEVFADFIIGDFLTVVALMIGLAAKTLFTERAQRRQFDTSELLQQSYTMVEQQVRERTAELQVTNTMLTTEIDERKRAEEQINKINNDLLQKTAELEQLVYVASHDLRSPLVNVQGFSRELGLLAEEIKEITSHAGLPDKQQARLSDIVNKEFPEARNYILASVVKMDTLLNGLLKLSRLGRAAVTLQKIDMNEMLISVLKTMEFQVKQSGVSVEITPLPSCVGDPVQTNQVFTNLLDNAVKYRDPNRPGIIRITGKTVKNFSEYCVEDNGIGIAPEHQSRVFEIFRRLDPQATEGDGLGLTIVKKIVSRLNGSIRLESEAGRGSRFFVTLPGK